MQNVCLVTTQSFKWGKSGHQNMETFAFASAVHGYHVYQELFTPSVGWHTVTHSATPRVPLCCSYHILTSSVIHYWTDAPQHRIYLFKWLWYHFGHVSLPYKIQHQKSPYQNKNFKSCNHLASITFVFLAHFKCYSHRINFMVFYCNCYLFHWKAPWRRGKNMNVCTCNANHQSLEIFPRIWLVKTIHIINHNQLLLTKYWTNDFKIAAHCKLLNQWSQNEVKSSARCRLFSHWLSKSRDKNALYLVSRKTRNKMAKLLKEWKIFWMNNRAIIDNDNVYSAHIIVYHWF